MITRKSQESEQKLISNVHDAPDTNFKLVFVCEQSEACNKVNQGP